jgi:hypothetical protein
MARHGMALHDVGKLSDAEKNEGAVESIKSSHVKEAISGGGGGGGVVVSD